MVEYQKVIKEVLARAGLSQQQLAEELDIQQSTVSAYLRGEYAPRRGVLRRLRELATKHGVTVDDAMDAPLSEREIGRLEGRLQQAEQEVGWYRQRIEGVLKACEETQSLTRSPSSDRREATPRGAAVTGSHGAR